MKTSKYKIKLVCGYRKDQEFTIDANEAHKAYYLFANPDARAVFSTGLALKGSDIQRIEPDYHATGGFNFDYKLVSEDMNAMHRDGTVAKLRDIMVNAREIAKIAPPEQLAVPLSTLLQNEYKALAEGNGSPYAQQLLAGKGK